MKTDKQFGIMNRKLKKLKNAEEEAAKTDEEAAPKEDEDMLIGNHKALLDKEAKE
jgi:hypothetical protein